MNLNWTFKLKPLHSISESPSITYHVWFYSKNLWSFFVSNCIILNRLCLSVSEFKTRQLQSQAHIRQWVWSDTFFSLIVWSKTSLIFVMNGDFCISNLVKLMFNSVFFLCVLAGYCLPNEFKYRAWHTLVDDSVFLEGKNIIHAFAVSIDIAFGTILFMTTDLYGEDNANLCAVIINHNRT